MKKIDPSAKIFKIDVRVYYEDTDFSGIVYHANHLKFFERGRTDALREIGVIHTQLLAREHPLVFAVQKMTTHWVRPAKIDDLLDVRTQFSHARGARMELVQEIWREQEIIACAEVEAACLSLEGKPRRLPEDVIEKFV